MSFSICSVTVSTAGVDLLVKAAVLHEGQGAGLQSNVGMLLFLKVFLLKACKLQCSMSNSTLRVYYECTQSVLHRGIEVHRGHRELVLGDSLWAPMNPNDAVPVDPS